MLAEGLRQTKFEAMLGVPPQLLPMAPSTSLLSCWYMKLREVFGNFDELEILVSSSDGYRSMDQLSGDSRFKRVIDPRSHRGTGGVLADYLQARDSSNADLDYLVVIDRSSCPPNSLAGFMSDLEASPDILVGVSELDRLTGIMAIKPHVLDLVPEVGYFDLKEQTVDKAIQSGFSVSASVVMPRAISVRSLLGWLAAIRYLGIEQEKPVGPVAYADRGINCIDPGARIGKAIILDSIIMDNAQVGDGAVVARSVVCSGAYVAPGRRVIDSVIDQPMSAAV